MDKKRRKAHLCRKEKHRGVGYLHQATEDAPYDVDGVEYCGRCHRSDCKSLIRQ